MPQANVATPCWSVTALPIMAAPEKNRTGTPATGPPDAVTVALSTTGAEKTNDVAPL